jgi:hypothetical protein
MFWQYLGVAVVAQVATRHGAAETEAEAAGSLIHLFIGYGVGIAVILFWTGIYLEGRSAKAHTV